MLIFLRFIKCVHWLKLSLLTQRAMVEAPEIMEVDQFDQFVFIKIV